MVPIPRNIFWYSFATKLILNYSTPTEQIKVWLKLLKIKVERKIQKSIKVLLKIKIKKQITLQIL